MGGEETKVAERFCGLHRHWKTAQTGKTKRHPGRMDERTPGWCKHATAGQNKRENQKVS